MVTETMVLRIASLVFLGAIVFQAQSTQPPSSDSDQSNPAAAVPEAPPIVSCPAGAPLGSVDLEVHPPDDKEPLPFRNINHLTEGQTLLYSPILRGREKRPGEIALVMVPLKRESDQDLVIVTDPKSANKPQEWEIPQTISLAGFVYGPAGLSKRKVRSFLSQDNVLIAQLADYAAKTSQTEALVQALSNSESSSASVNAALTGFASQYGFAVQIDRTAPPAVQAETLFATMNPQLATYNPLAPSTASNVGQTASLMTAAATLFFGSPVGLAAGGTAMLLDLRAIAFPDTQFRSSFAEPLPTTMPHTGVNLCGQQGPAPLHTRVAYIWATRIPNTPSPSIHIGKSDFIPVAQKSPVPVEVPEPEWKYLQRARAWSLENDKNQKTPIKVLKLGNQKALELDLTKAKLPSGDYHLSGYWDWTRFEAEGTVHVLPLGDFKQAKLEPTSQDRLLAKSGKVPVTVAGSDFEFTTKVEMKKVGDEFATAQPVRFILPEGLRDGPQEHMDVQIDTGDLDPGDYELLVYQQNGKSHPVDFKVLPNPPKIANLPIIVNQGVAMQHYVLKGEHLDLLTKLEAPGAKFDLGSDGASDNERSVTVQLKSNLEPGAALPVTAYLENRSAPLQLPGALQITGPLPVIASSKLSPPSGMAISVQGDELPAGYTLNAMLDVKNVEHASVLRLSCAGDTSSRATLQIGEQTASSSLQQLSQDQLFLSFDTTPLLAGCTLQAVIDNGRDGQSQRASLARIVRLPQIDSFELGDQPATNGLRTYLLTGRDLEMISKVGWDKNNGADVSSLPAPIPGQGQKQSLSISLPDPPSAQAALYIWLRGEKEGRATTIQAPPLPAPAPAPAIPPNSAPAVPTPAPATPPPPSEPAPTPPSK